MPCKLVNAFVALSMESGDMLGTYLNKRLLFFKDLVFEAQGLYKLIVFYYILELLLFFLRDKLKNKVFSMKFSRSLFCRFV